MTHATTPAWRRDGSSRWLLPALLAIAALIAFWRLGGHGVRMWDETRYGENALQMLQRGDYLNYYYDDQMDDWVAKPPLGMWLITLAYKLVGFNEWALRLPSALAGLVAVFLTYQLVRLFKGPVSAAWAGLAVVTCRGILGPHVSRSGDLDALYVATALGVVYFMVRFTQRNERWALVASALCAALCFYTKGFMLLLFLPGLGLFLLLRSHVLKVLKAWTFWLGLTLLAGSVFAWYLVIHRYGNRFPHSPYGSDAWDVMINYDIRRRFTEKLEGDQTTPAFVFEALDTRYSPWLYLLYLSLLLLLWRSKGRLGRAWKRLRQDELLALCVCLSGGVCLVLANSATKFNWYFALTIPFLAILTQLCWRWAAGSKRRLFWGLSCACALSGLVMQVFTVTKHEDGLTDALLEQMPLVLGAKHIYASRQPGFNTTLTLKWRQRRLEGPPPEAPAASLQLVHAKLGVLHHDDGSYSVLLLPGHGD